MGVRRFAPIIFDGANVTYNASGVGRHIFTVDGYPGLTVDGALNIAYLYGSTASTADLFIYPNTTSVYPFWKLNGDGHFNAQLPTTKAFNLYNETVLGMVFEPDVAHGSTHSKIATDANFDLLFDTGTGVVRFGLYAGSGDVACNGSVTIKDMAGNTRKLMTTA